MRDWIVDPHFLSLSTTWKCVVNFTLWFLRLLGKPPPTAPIEYCAGWISQIVWTFSEKRESFVPAVNEPRILGHPTHNLSVPVILRRAISTIIFPLNRPSKWKFPDNLGAKT